MKVCKTFLLGLAIILPVVCHGQEQCPWINEATARGVLGGEIKMITKVSDQGGGVCRFLRQRGESVYELRVSVEVMTDIPTQFHTYLEQCPPKSTALPAVGNEAVICSLQGKGEPYTEKVVGRVRNKAFIVSVSSSIQEDRLMTQETRREKANLVAEQVAGILF